MNNKQHAVLNTKGAMDIILSEAKKTIALKFDTTVDVVDMAIREQNENVLSMMRKLVKAGIDEVAAL